MSIMDEPQAWELAREMHALARMLPAVRGGDGPFDGVVLARCRRVHHATGSSVLFTRDVGMHSCGWWRNPDYERCFHLSLAFFDPETHQHAPQDHKMAAKWCEYFFRDATRLLWVEPPHTEQGKQDEVWHYRLFMDESWTVPLLPRGEVYSRELTEAGWKSFSELQASEEITR